MATIQTCSVNLLELGTTTLTAGAAAAGYPLYRVYDRDPGRLFVGSAAATTTIHVDQGAAGAQAVDRLLIPSGHNLAGVTLDIQWSTDNAAWNDAVSQWTGVAGDINKSWAALTKRYWRFVMTSPAAAPQLAELFLTASETWTRNPDHPGGAEEPVYNVTVAVSAEGRPRFEVNGSSLAQRNYQLSGMTDAHRTQLLAIWAAFAGCKPFWLCDPAGAWIFGRMTSQPQIRTTYDADGVGEHSAVFNFLQVPS